MSFHYDGLRFQTLNEVMFKIGNRAKCWSCESKEVNIQGFPEYPHDGGIQIGTKKYWIYLHCLKCSYDTSLWKLRLEGLM